MVIFACACTRKISINGLSELCITQHHGKMFSTASEQDSTSPHLTPRVVIGRRSSVSPARCSKHSTLRSKSTASSDSHLACQSHLRYSTANKMFAFLAGNGSAGLSAERPLPARAGHLWYSHLLSRWRHL